MRLAKSFRWPLLCALCCAALGAHTTVQATAQGSGGGGGGGGAVGQVVRPGLDAAVVRYQVADVNRSVAFYTRTLGPELGFTLQHQTGPFASVVRGKLVLILSGPGTSGARPMPDGRKQAPGGWNRIVLYVDNLEGHAGRLKKAGVPFRNGVEHGPGGSQVLIDDPDGNPIELHEAPKL
jgi:Lactoylglutathione lyase and related lyases